MTAPRILTACTSWIDNEATVELVKLWFRVWHHLNPGEDIILIDACSPFDPALFLPNPPEIFRWPENVGAITRGGKDGSGRSCCKAIELAIGRDYDYVAVYETDFVLARSLRPMFEKMHRTGVKVASLSLANPYLFPEWGVLFINVQYAKDTKFIERYDWENSPRWPLVEMRLEQMFRDDLFFFNVRGLRNDQNQINVANIANNFPYGPCQWLTHCADPNVYSRMLELNSVVPE